MLLYGASGHAKVINSILRATGQEVTAIFDDDLGKKNLGDIAVVGQYDPDFQTAAPLIISIGYNDIRRKVAGKIRHRFGRAIHPSALIDETATIGEGTVIMPGVIVQADARIGRHVIVNTAATVDHDCLLGDFVHIAPGVVLCGAVQVGESTLIGAGCVVAPNLTIGANCLIAAGSVVTTHIPDGATVRGNPARVVGNFEAGSPR
ncbi:acetyltransferase [Persicitalea jodogahamensis]|uniref:Acetyltransferase n=1 Tax=Persicitalea jodogahamensis TaxID=402147 RepID=A0A8J3D586_9BACT|nr:acetyltransferase [Persicitalea jodogahamensis]GHB54808.1 acetyltransferase [Persicitalea jodogahamensis]